jgi:hypothetical protein
VKPEFNASQLVSRETLVTVTSRLPGTAIVSSLSPSHRHCDIFYLPYIVIFVTLSSAHFYRDSSVGIATRLPAGREESVFDFQKM